MGAEITQAKGCLVSPNAGAVVFLIPELSSSSSCSKWAAKEKACCPPSHRKQPGCGALEGTSSVQHNTCFDPARAAASSQQGAQLGARHRKLRIPGIGCPGEIEDVRRGLPTCARFP